MTLAPFELGGTSVEPGTRERIQVALPDLLNGASISMPVKVFHGVEPGPVVWISAAIHGDEINGVDIVRRVIPHLDPTAMRGTVLVVPIVDVYGFNRGDRYMPDRRDLNRSFPGSSRGSLASRVAHRFRTTVVERCDAGIDLHTASNGRVNLPQVRGVTSDEEFCKLAAAFSAPVTMDSKVIDGSLRKLAASRGIPYLLYEAGAANMFDTASISVGVDGCLRTLEHLAVIDDAPAAESEPVLIPKSSWLRAPASGIIEQVTTLGAVVEKGDVLAVVTDTFGASGAKVRARRRGMVLSMAMNPLVHAGDAMVLIGHLA